MSAWTTIRIARSAGRHGISPWRIAHVVEHPFLLSRLPAAVDPAWSAERLLFLGDDARGVPLEVVAVETDDGGLLVIQP